MPIKEKCPGLDTVFFSGQTVNVANECRIYRSFCSPLPVDFLAVGMVAETGRSTTCAGTGCKERDALRETAYSRVLLLPHSQQLPAARSIRLFMISVV